MEGSFESLLEEPESFIFDEVDWTTLIEPGTKIHVVHGGSSDQQGVFDCASHLQAAWDACILWAHTRAQLSDILSTLCDGQWPRQLTRLIVCLSAQAVALYPEAYDRLLSMPFITVLVTLPITAVTGSAYSSRSNIVALFLASCRVDMEYISTCAKVYRFPADVSMLEQSLWNLPHGLGISWKVGQSRSPSFVSFSMPASISHQQDAVDKLFWWSKSTMLIPDLLQVPTEPLESIVMSKCCSFNPAMGEPPKRIDARTIEFVTNMDQDMLAACRSSAKRCTQKSDFHLVTESRAVIPFRMVLADSGEVRNADGSISLVVQCQSPAKKCMPSPTPSTAWKSFITSLPEI